MNKIKKFSKLVSYEFTRLFRNKVMISLLLLFSVILLVVIAFSGDASNGLSNAKITLFTDGKSVDDIQAVTLIKDNYDMNNIIIVNSVEEGIDSVKHEKAIFFIEVNAETTPETLVIHYDGYSNASNKIRDKLSNGQNSYSYDAIKEFLSDCGIKINSSYFEIMSFKSINMGTTWGVTSSFVISVASGLSIVILFGLAYSMSRDNETRVSKILSYMPINRHAYLSAKIATYLIIGLVELMLLLLLGWLFFGITFEINVLLIILISIVFLLATACIGILFSTFRSQMIAAMLSIAVILIPIFLTNMFMFQGLAIPIKVLLLAMPITPFIQLLHGMIFNGVIMWGYVILLLVESIIFYLITCLIMHKNLKKN